MIPSALQKMENLPPHPSLINHQNDKEKGLIKSD